jgi:polar amino acid transport system permease protein
MNTVCPEKPRRFNEFFRFSTLLAFLKFFGLICLAVWVLAAGTAELGYNWQWYRVPRFIFAFVDGRFQPGPLLKGLLVTFHITGVSLVLFFVFGLTTALMRRSRFFTLRFLARFYLELIRNTPLLIQLFFIYFALSPIVGLGAFASAVLALSLFEGAYASEIFRAGIDSIPRGQWEAAHSLGLSNFQTYRHVVLPQAIRHILPPLTSQSISLVKDSALVSTIAIYDLTMQGQAIVSETFLSFEIWFTVAAIYLAITLTLSFLVRLMENRLRLG